MDIQHNRKKFPVFTRRVIYYTFFHERSGCQRRIWMRESHCKRMCMSGCIYKYMYMDIHANWCVLVHHCSLKFDTRKDEIMAT